jgi:hypothetical protein
MKSSRDFENGLHGKYNVMWLGIFVIGCDSFGVYFWEINASGWDFQNDGLLPKIGIVYQVSTLENVLELCINLSTFLSSLVLRSTPSDLSFRHCVAC